MQEASQLPGPAAGGPASPNVLVILCDQLRLDLLGCYGGALVRTPHIDRLARDAAIFDRCYTPTAICTPARASLLTGLYPHAHFLYSNWGGTADDSLSDHLRRGVVMLQDWLADHTSYETGYFGKWHLGPASELFAARFDHTQQPQATDPDVLRGSMWHPSLSLGPLITAAPGGKDGLIDIPMENFPDAVCARLSQEFLRSRVPHRPFVLFCSLPGPHAPWLIPAEFGRRVDPRNIPMWPNRHDPFENKPLNQKKLRLLQLRQHPHAANDENLLELLAYNFSYIELVDEMIGRVISTLKEQGLYDSTAIFLTADHGDMAGAHGFKSKGAYMYDEIYRIPLLFKPAGSHHHKRVSVPVTLMDITATIMHAVTGCPQSHLAEQALHGQSLLPLAREADPTTWSREVHYAEYHGDWHGHYSSRMVTDGNWKLVSNLSDLGELYCLDEDPYELRNRFYDPACASVRDRYLEILAEEARRLGDPHMRFYSPVVERELASLLVAELGPMHG